MGQPRAIIIGAGPAGGAAAVHLARRGWQCTLVEARTFPRQKVCGEFISPAATPFLEDLLSVAALRALDAQRVDVMALECGTKSSEWPMPRAAWVLSRAVLDTALRDVARLAGAEVLQPAAVRAVRYQPDRVSIELNDGRGLHADVVIHADGTGRHDLAGPTPLAPGVLGHKCHLRIPGGVRGVRIRTAPGAYVGLVQIEAGGATCALVARRGLIAAHRGDADAMLHALWPAYDPAWRVCDWHSCGVTRSGYVRPGHVRSFRIGNAAGAVDPVGGEGIGLALWAATELTRGLTSVEPEALRALHARFAAAYRARLRVRRFACRWTATGLMQPALVRALWPLLSRPSAVLAPWYRLSGKPA